MLDRSPLVVLGCGFLGTVAAGLHRASGARVIATTRAPDRAEGLARRGVEVHVLPSLTADVVDRLLPERAAVLITFPPDGSTDAAIAPSLHRARALVYISSTAVYGDATGRVDESTPVSSASPRAAARLAAEAMYRDLGGIVLRAAGIYGPGRGLHQRLLRGEYRLLGTDGERGAGRTALPGEPGPQASTQGRNVVSRIHVEDLARLALAALDRAPAGEVFVVGDDEPVPQIEVVRWLCSRLGVALPEAAPAEQMHDTLRHDRSVDNAKIKNALGMMLLYPSYREGFEACLAVERAQGGLPLG